MDNPKKANQGKYNRSKRKKEHHSKGGKNCSSSPAENSKTHHHRDKSSNYKGSHALTNAQQSSSTTKPGVTASKTELTEEQKIALANRKKETEEISQLTQKYSRRSIISTWARDFEIPKSKDSLSSDDEGTDFKELMGGHSTYFVGGHFLLKEEREWLNESESCESPFSLDLKCLEAGISCIPFFKRHGLSEKSFSPKEIQSMINEAEASEVIYKEMKNMPPETHKVLLNKRKTNSDSISKDFLDEDDILIAKCNDKKSSSDGTASNNSTLNGKMNYEPVKCQNDFKTSISTEQSSEKCKNIPSLDGFNYETSDASQSSVIIDEPLITSYVRRSQCLSRLRQNFYSMTNSQKYSYENSRADSNSSEGENNDISLPQSTIQSLEPRDQRRARREARQDKTDVNIDVNDVQSNFSDYSLVGLNSRSENIIEGVKPSIADNYLRLKNQETVKKSSDSEMRVDDDFWVGNFKAEESLDVRDKTSLSSDVNDEKSDKYTDGADYLSMSCSKKDELTLIQAEIESNCDRLNINFLNRSKAYSVPEVKNDIELDLSVLKEFNDQGKSNDTINESYNSSLKILCESNVVSENIISDLSVQDSVKAESKINKENDDFLKCSYKSDNNQSANKASNVKTNELISSSYDHDLDFLLGLGKSSAMTLSQPSSSETKINTSSNLSILQEKLNVAVVENECQEAEVGVTLIKGPVRCKPTGTVIAASGKNELDEDLDEWLNSVLES